MGSTKTVNTILLGGEILKALAGGASRLEDIYPRVGLNKSTAHRILKSLAQSGLAYQHPLGRTYHIGPLFLQASAGAAKTHHLLVVSALEEMRRLRATSRETVLLLIPLGDQRLVLKEFPSEQGISLSHGEGSTLPIMIGSAGRVLLSLYDDATLRKLFAQLAVPAVAPGFMADAELRMREIEAIRAQGYALSSGEMIPDSAGISVPVKGYVSPVALSVFGPKFRFRPLEILEEIRVSAEVISGRLAALMSPGAEPGSTGHSGTTAPQKADTASRKDKKERKR
jgi:DNA-binding IclR family transcriptional regulator